MKKILSFLSAILLLTTTLLSVVCFGVVAAGEETPAVAEDDAVIINVKDFGAVGDGKTDDRTAIMEAFHFALTEYMQYAIPVTVYFPEGQYGLLNGGMYIYLPRGYGNLTVKGDGADKSTIVYLDEWDNNGSWVALRIQPKIKPESVDQYLHDITIQDLGVYDTDPAKHAWHVDKGDPDTEETHGFNIQYCMRATIKNCQTVDVGDECFDLSHCMDAVMTENLVVKNRITGKGGGSFSVGDGSKNVTIANNAVIFNDNDPSISHYGFAVEALAEHIEDIYITDNTAQNVNGWGVSIAAPGGTVHNVLLQNNRLVDCHEGGVRFSGTGRTTDTRVLDNHITNTRFGVCVDGSNKVGTLVENCTIENLSSYGVSVNSPRNSDTVVRNIIIRNAKWRAIYNAGTNTLVDRVLVDGSGTAGGVTDSAVIQYTGGGDCTMTNSALLNCQNKRAIQGIKKVANTYIQQPEISGYTAMSGVMQIEDCWVNRLVTIKTGCTIDGLVVYATQDLGTHAINLSGLTDCTITNCLFVQPSRYSINEAGAADNNVFANNVCVGGSGIKVLGANTVSTGNVRSSLAAAESFNYYVADGVATVVSPADAALTDLTIPSAVEGVSVTAVAPWAFALCESLTTVSIPDTLLSVGAYAFYGCSALTTVNYGGLEPQRESLAIGGENTTLTDAVWTYHWNNHNYDNACDAQCNDCAFIREIGDHVYDNACDASCNECGFVREVPDHIYESVVVAPDCVRDGYTAHVCTVCGDTYHTDEMTAYGHNYELVVTAPDCENGGYTTHTCTACGDSYVSDEIAARGHRYVGNTTKEPTCTAYGVVTYVCEICGDSYEDHSQLIPTDHAYDHACDPDCNVCGDSREITHVYESVVTAPDCENGGYTTHTCTVCGDSYVSDEIIALGHVYDHACDAACSACGFIREVGDHIYDNDKDVDCNECGFVREVSIPGDANGDGEITNRDLALLQQYINNWEIDLDVDAMDVNGDGEITNRDLALLQQYINGWDVELK